ncbi:MAG: lipopolysaccharide assembly protein LapA domain-containing protein [Reyranella sp.]|nr:lipopolysaccharide assembly protein LapA domain-containing protein [Reyranella sp.]
MKILSRALFLLFVLVGVLMAVSNTQLVQLALWPLPHIIVMPVYLLVVGLLLLGVLAGLGLGWWAARHHRRRAREAGSEAARLEREAAHLRAGLAAQQPAPTATGPASPGQRAIERQSALVAPDLAAPATRGPFS